MRLWGYKIFKERALDSCFFNREKLFSVLLAGIERPVIFDVGANIGQSIEFFKSKRHEAIVHSFEPNLECATSLKGMAMRYRDVHVNMIGVGAGGGDFCCINTAKAQLIASLKSPPILMQSWRKAIRRLTRHSCNRIPIAWSVM